MIDHGDIDSSRFDNASESHSDLFLQIGKLSDEDITEKTAPFIGGLLAARSLEISFLDARKIRGDKAYSKTKNDLDRKDIGKPMKILTDARKGNFTGLKKLLGEQALAYELTPEEKESGEEVDPEFLEFSKKMRTIIQRIPDRGDGSVIKVPNPIHIEKPVPLKIQIERFNAGGEIR